MIPGHTYSQNAFYSHNIPSPQPAFSFPEAPFPHTQLTGGPQRQIFIGSSTGQAAYENVAYSNPSDQAVQSWDQVWLSTPNQAMQSLDQAWLASLSQAVENPNPAGLAASSRISDLGS